MLAAHLHFLLEAQPPADLGRLVEHLPREWIVRFPLFFVFQQASFMQPVFPDSAP